MTLIVVSFTVVKLKFIFFASQKNQTTTKMLIIVFSFIILPKAMDGFLFERKMFMENTFMLLYITTISL